MAEKFVDTSETPMPQIDRKPPVQEEQKIPMNLLPVDQVSAEQMPEQQPAEEPPTEKPIIAPPPVQSDIDPFTGKSWREIALEEKRKREELADRLPQMIDEKLSKVTQPQQPQYTYEQLEAYKLQNANDPNIVAWTTGEQQKMQNANQRKMLQEIVGAEREVTKAEQLRQASLTYVRNTYPEAFGSDGNWDFSKPITQTIRTYMQNPKISGDPEGLILAANAAYGVVQKQQLPVLQKQVQQAKADVKQAQKASLTEGAGRRVTPNALPQQTAIDTLRKTGNIKDAESAMGAVMRARGLIVD